MKLITNLDLWLIFFNSVTFRWKKLFQTFAGSIISGTLSTVFGSFYGFFHSLFSILQLRLNALMENAVAEVNKQVKINGTPVIKISDISKNIAVQTLGTGYFNATNGCFG